MTNISQHNLHSFKPILLTIFILSIIQPTICQLNTKRFLTIDHGSTHYLIRGNLPIANNTFQFENLYQSLANYTGINGFRLVIVSLLNSFTSKQTKNRYIEENIFDEEGMHIYKKIQHFYISHPIIGSFVGPGDLPAFLRKYALKFYKILSLDNVPDLLTKLQQKMHSPIKTVVYIHCSQGIDRVGYIAAAYKMKNLGYTFTDAMVENFQLTKTVREHMHFNSFKALQWYCLHLGKSQEECLVRVEEANYVKSFEQHTKKVIGQPHKHRNQIDNKQQKQEQL